MSCRNLTHSAARCRCRVRVLRCNSRATRVRCGARHTSPDTGSGIHTVYGGIRPLKFHALGVDSTAGATAADRYDPSETEVDQGRRFRVIGKQSAKLNHAFVAASRDFYFFRASELLVACHALECVAKGTGAERRDGDGVVALYAFFGS
jgi:hypothetical protein